MASGSSDSSDSSHDRLDRHASIDSTASSWTISSVASSTRAQPRSIVSYSEFYTETESTESLHTRPYSPVDDRNSSLPFYVLCREDFDSDDPDHLSFKKDKILKVIQQEPSGWWAAQAGERVGWIPSAFVDPISYETPVLVQDFGYRAYESETEASYDVELESNLPLHQPSPEDQETYEQDYDYQVAARHLQSPRGFPTDVTPAIPRFELPQDLPSLHSPSPGVLVDPWHAHQIPNLNVPTTPRTPLPPNFPAPEPFSRPPEEFRHPILTLDTTVPLLNKNKPTPPTPMANTPMSPPPKTSPTSLSRSRSAGSIPTTNLGRRRPEGLMVHTPISLGQPGSLVDTPQGFNEIDDDIWTRQDLKLRRNATWRPPKVWRITGDDDAQAFHNAQLAQASQPWYLKPQHIGDVIKMEYDGSVKAGTLEALVERLTVEPLKLELEDKFRHTFLMTFCTFSTADRILELLVDRYDLEPPEGLAREEFEDWKERKLAPTQARVLHVFNLWVDKYGLVEDDPQIIARLRDFLSLIVSPSALAASAKHVMSVLERARNPDISLPLSATSAPRRRNTRRNRNDLLKIDPAELAKQLTLYEARLYVKVRPQECLAWTGTQKGETVQNLHSFVSTNDKIASWVKMSVLSNDVLGKRADTIELWIKVADKCRVLNNFSSMSAIVAALTSQVIARLKLTWAHVTKMSHLEPLIKLADPKNNFSTYRTLFSSIDGPCLPFIGIFLSDMVKVKETFPDCVSVPASETNPQMLLINFMKRKKMAEVGHAILRHQSQVRDQYKISEVTDIIQYLAAQLKIAAGKDEGSFWLRSQEVQQAELAHADIRKGLEKAGF